jgi:hypothetical protein
LDVLVYEYIQTLQMNLLIQGMGVFSADGTIMVLKTVVPRRFQAHYLKSTMAVFAVAFRSITHISLRKGESFLPMA